MLVSALEYPTLSAWIVGEQSSYRPVVMLGGVRKSIEDATGGIAFNFTISSELPLGLTMDKYSGVLRGVAEVETSRALLTITADLNASDETVAQLNLQPEQRKLECIVEVACVRALEGLAYPAAELVIDQEGSESTSPRGLPPLNSNGSDAHTTALLRPASPWRKGLQRPSKYFNTKPSLQSGQADAFEISPPLPDGFSFDEMTGAIEGRPSRIQTGHSSDHVVLASNAASIASCGLRFEAESGAWGLVWLRFHPERVVPVQPLPEEAFPQGYSTRDNSPLPLDRQLSGSSFASFGMASLEEHVEAMPATTPRNGTLPPLDDQLADYGTASSAEDTLALLSPDRPATALRPKSRQLRTPGIVVSTPVDWSSVVKKSLAFVGLFGKPVPLRFHGVDAAGTRSQPKGLSLSVLLRLLKFEQDAASANVLLRALNGSGSVLPGSSQMAVIPAAMLGRGMQEPVVVLKSEGVDIFGAQPPGAQSGVPQQSIPKLPSPKAPVPATDPAKAVQSLATWSVQAPSTLPAPGARRPLPGVAANGRGPRFEDLMSGGNLFTPDLLTAWRKTNVEAVGKDLSEKRKGLATKSLTKIFEIEEDEGDESQVLS